MKKMVLGKGLDALIPSESTTATVDEAELKHISLDAIAPNPLQPRQEFKATALQELAESLKKHGVMQPLVVKPSGSGYIIIAGERRYRAARLAGLHDVPVIIREEVTDTEMLSLALVENLQREDLNPMETAEAYKMLIDSCNQTQHELAQQVGRSRTAVANSLRLLQLPDRIKEMLRDGRLTEGHARAILALPTEEEMISLADRIVSASLSVRVVEEEVGKQKKRRLIPKRKLPELTAVENRLKQMFGTSVHVHHGLKKGRIEIEYYGNEDLERILELFDKLR